MIALELLGLDAQGANLQLTDAEGNRYSIAITNELRAALRRDVHERNHEEPKPITTREIQAYFRAGKTIDDVSELTNLPPSRLDALAYPIIEERKYTAGVAQNFLISRDSGALTLAEVVISRLVDRGISPESVSWDAYREPGMPWVLSATYIIADSQFNALWQVDTKNRTLNAINDEATWLTETQIPTPRSPWRPLNTRTPDTSASEAADQPDTSPTPVKAASSSSGESTPAQTSDDVDIESVLADLDGKRGVQRPMPSIDDDVSPSSEPHIESDDTPERVIATETMPVSDVVSLDGFRTSARKTRTQDGSEKTFKETVEEESTQGSLPGLDAQPTATSDLEESAAQDAQKKSKTSRRAKRRSGRPTMPSWDEIVFGTSRDGDKH